MNIFKSKLGIEDVEIGTDAVTQERGSVVTSYNQVSMPYNCGILNSNYKTAPAVDILYFTGFYTPGDYGAGIYTKLDTEQEEDIGVILYTEKAKYRRIGSENSVMPEWFGAKGDGVTNDIAVFETLLNSQYNIRLRPNATYYLNTFTSIKLNLPYIYLQGNGATIKTSRDNEMFRITVDQQATVYINNLRFEGPSDVIIFATLNGKTINGNVTYNVFNNIALADFGTFIDTSSTQTIDNLEVQTLFTIQPSSNTSNTLVTKKQVDETSELPDNLASKQDTIITGLKTIDTLTLNREPNFIPTPTDILTYDEVTKYLEDNVAQYLPSMDTKLVSVPVGETYTQYKANVYTGVSNGKQETIYLFTDKLAKVSGGYRVVDGNLEILTITVNGTSLTCNNGKTTFTVTGGTIATEYLSSQEPEVIYGGVWSLVYEATYCKYWRKL